MKKRMTTVALASMMFASSTLSMVCADSNANSDDTKKQLSDVRQDKKKVQSQLSETQKSIDKVNSDVSNITSELNEVLNKKIENEKKLLETQKKLDAEMSSLKTQLANYYMNSFNSNTSMLESLVKSSSTSDFIVKSTYLKYIVDNKDKIVEDVEALLEEQNNILADIKSNEEELTTIKDSLLDRQAQLESQKQKTKISLNKLNIKEAELQDILIVQEQEELDIQEQINKDNSSSENKVEVENIDSNHTSTNSDNNSQDESIKEDSNSSIDKENNESSTESENMVNNNNSKPSESNSNTNSDKLVNNVNSKGFKCPVANYRFTSKYGYRTHPVTGQYKMHTGVDLAAAKGTKITSAKSGEVVISKYSSSYGNYVVVNHDNGISTLYAHLDKRTVSVGDKVSVGDEIGLMGSTGMSTGPHLHFEVRVNGKHVDPTLYVDIA